MKKIKVAALAMALVLVCLTLAACGGSPKVSVNCKISVMINDEYVLDHYAYTVEGTEAEPPTVLQAAQEALTMVEIGYEIDEAGNSFESISYDGTDYKTGLDAAGENICTWVYTADGVEPEEGRAGTNAILEGQDIVFTYVSTPMNVVEFSEEE